jgi:large subunit ribosomal protein L30e
MDVNKQIRMAVKTGKVDFGSKSALSSASLGKAKLLILARNCPEEFRENIVDDAEQSEIPIYIFQGSSLDLGALCEKPFPVASMVVKEPGDSEVLKLAENK